MLNQKWFILWICLCHVSNAWRSSMLLSQKKMFEFFHTLTQTVVEIAFSHVSTWNIWCVLTHLVQHIFRYHFISFQLHLSLHIIAYELISDKSEKKKIQLKVIFVICSMLFEIIIFFLFFVCGSKWEQSKAPKHVSHKKRIIFPWRKIDKMNEETKKQKQKSYENRCESIQNFYSKNKKENCLPWFILKLVIWIWKRG